MPDVESSHWKSKIHRIDFPGAAALVSAVFALLLGLDRGSNLSWSAPITIISLSVSLPLFALFILIEQKYASEPFAPRHIIFNKCISAFYPCNFFAFCAWYVPPYSIYNNRLTPNPGSLSSTSPLFSQAVDSCDATVAGIRLLRGIIAGTIGSLFAGLMMQWTGCFYTLTIFAYSTLTLGFVPILLFSGLAAKSTWAISIGLAACGFGNGIGLTTSLIGLIANVSPQDQAVATACSYLFRSLGAAVGLLLSATVVQEALMIQPKEHLGIEGDANAIAEGVRLSLDFIDHLEPGLQDIVRRCYGTATRARFVLMLGLATLAIVSSCKLNVYGMCLHASPLM